jgi:glycosyltransferase involved in cell wall biosynthesis
MKVYITPRDTAHAFAIWRTANALKRYAPDYVKFTDNINEADLVVLHVIGRRDRTVRQAEWLLDRDKQIAVIQYCLLSTQCPSTADWLPLWLCSQMVWSYFDLPAMMAKEGQKSAPFNFYYAPLGVDSNVFYPISVNKEYVICTSGGSYMSESVRECVHAAGRVGKRVAHLGVHQGRKFCELPNVDCYSGITDQEVTRLYNSCEYISGLRRTEGFELPAAEGLLCGVRPVLFDQPHYRAWYDGLGIFIPETQREQIINDVEAVFRSEYKPVTNEERAEAAGRFNWQTIAEGFWQCLLSA